MHIRRAEQALLVRCNSAVRTLAVRAGADGCKAGAAPPFRSLHIACYPYVEMIYLGTKLPAL